MRSTKLVSLRCALGGHRMKYNIASAVLLTVLLHAGLGSAANIWFESASDTTPLTNLVIEGQIRPGDFEALSKALRDRGPSVQAGYLYSPGGDAREAMKIGTLLRSLQIETRGPQPYFPIHAKDDIPLPQCSSPAPKVEANCLCYSACFLVWAAGANRAESLVGVHRPAFDRSLFASLSATDAEKAYEVALGEMDVYLDALRIPQEIRERMQSTPSREIHKFVTPQSMNGFAPAYDELISARCNLLTKQQEGRYWVLNRKIKQRRATYDEILEEDELAKRYKEAMICHAYQSISMRVDAFSEHYKIDYARRIKGGS